MQDYIIVRDPRQPFGGMGGGMPGQFPGMQVMPMGFMGMSPGFMGMSPGFMGMSPGFMGMSPGFMGQDPPPGSPFGGGFSEQDPPPRPPFGGPGFPGGPPGGGPGFPGGPPVSGPGFPGGPPGPGPGFPTGPQGGGPPQGRPPTFVPQIASAHHVVGSFAVESGALRPCRFRYVYIWLRNGQEFWAWLTFVGRTSIAGWRWTGTRWVFFGMDINRISAFVCF